MRQKGVHCPSRPRQQNPESGERSPQKNRTQQALLHHDRNLPACRRSCGRGSSETHIHDVYNSTYASAKARPPRFEPDSTERKREKWRGMGSRTAATETNGVSAGEKVASGVYLCPRGSFHRGPPAPGV